MEGHALLVGVPKLDHLHYKQPQPEYELSCVKGNLNRISSMIHSTGTYKSVHTIGLNGQTAKWSDFLNRLQAIKTELETGPFFFTIYILCHGAHFKIDGTNKKWGFLCFEDRMVSEYELRKKIIELLSINNQSKSYLIIESCYSYEFGFDQSTSFFEEVYKDNKKKGQTYYKLIEKSKGVPEHYPENVCFLASSKELQLIASSPKGITDFMNLYEQCWQKSNDHTYFTFFDLLQSAFTKECKPHQRPENPIKNGVFDLHKPFYFPLPSALLKAALVPFDIAVEEHPSPPGDKSVTVTMVNPPVNYYYTDSITMSDEKNGEDDFYIELKEKIAERDSTALNRVSVIGIIYVNTHGMTGTLFPTSGTGVSINYMESVGVGKNYPINGIVVVLVTNMSNGIIAHKRTKGKVSNTIGG